MQRNERRHNQEHDDEIPDDAARIDREGSESSTTVEKHILEVATDVGPGKPAILYPATTTAPARTSAPVVLECGAQHLRAARAIDHRLMMRVEDVNEERRKPHRRHVDRGLSDHNTATIQIAVPLRAKLLFARSFLATEPTRKAIMTKHQMNRNGPAAGVI